MTNQQFDKLIEKYLQGKASPAEEKLIDEFFTSQERKQKLEHYKLSDEMWSAIKDQIYHDGYAIQTNDQLQGQTDSSRRFGKIIIAISVAASLIIGLFITYQFGLFDRQTLVKMAHARSENGQKSIITLMDGSTIYLNSGSSVRYPETFAADKREVILDGEAFFEVKRDESRPFIVKTGSIETKVLGTSFNINAFSKSISVTVASGKVQVCKVHKQKASLDTNTVVLIRDQQAVYNSEKGDWVMYQVESERFIAWKNNILRFDGTSLEEAAETLERWYDVQIEFENDQIKNCLINGQFKNLRLSSVLESIQYMYKVNYKFNSHNQVLLYGEGCNK